MQFQQIIEMNELDISQYSTMSMSTKLNLSRNDFNQMLRILNAKVNDEEANLFFEYIMLQKVELYQKLYPHLHLTTKSMRLQDMQKKVGTAYESDHKVNNTNQYQAQLPEKISYTDFIIFFQKSYVE